MPSNDPLQAGIFIVRHGFAGLGARAILHRIGRWAAMAASSASVALCAALPALAQEAGQATAGFSFDTLEVIQFATFSGILLAAMISAVWLIRERARTAAENAELRGRVADLGTQAQRADALLNMRGQRVVVWDTEGKRPDLVGGLPAEAGAPEERAAFLAFGRWLTPRSAAALDHAVSGLRDHATPFDLTVETQNGALLDVQGRRSPSLALLRFTSLSQAQRAHAALRLEHQRLEGERTALLTLLDELNLPFWLRDASGHMQWVNRAYAKAVEAADPATAVREGRELLGTPVRAAIAAEEAHGRAFQQTVSTVIGGDRRMVTVTDAATPQGSAGIACDVSEIEAMRAEHERTVKSHSDTLDQINTAIAIFDADQKLRFFNQAFQRLWDLDLGFLESAPDHALMLDRLRSERKLAEQPEWRRWKENVLAAYRAVEPIADQWYLPDGRTLRVVGNPQPRGGVTWVFENLTEQIDLESRYRTAVRVQGETLDNLAEGVAVFGPDGRVRLSNPAFHQLWDFPSDLAAPGTHISALREAADARTTANPWNDFVASVTGFDETRNDRQGQVELTSGTILRHALIHLPNGQSMITFVDVTDSANVERALTDKNEALLRSEQLKNDFVQHVSYELRSPLTNIIGFTELLTQPTTGSLNDKQRDYLDHIGSSSSVLLTIVNDILDLATVDAGMVALDIAEVPVAETVNAAVGLVEDRLKEHAIELRTDLSQAPRTIFADEHRIKQILVNLLSNAGNFAPEGSTVTLACVEEADSAVFSVHDDGPGMPDDVLDTVFRRFEPRANGGRRRGAGLGLSIVKSFVELHGGVIDIETGSGRGTTVICRFPSRPARMREAAE
jgi:signal transduction histidine kinase